MKAVHNYIIFLHSLHCKNKVHAITPSFHTYELSNVSVSSAQKLCKTGIIFKVGRPSGNSSVANANFLSVQYPFSDRLETVLQH
jgi:hypothetical protein